MSVVLVLPTAGAIASLLSDLVGCKVAVTPSRAHPTHKPRGCASYVTKANLVLFVAQTFGGFLESAGAALAMIPPAVVADSLKARVPESVLVENGFEVMNVMASLFNRLDEVHHDVHHVKIERLVTAEPIVAEALARRLKTSVRRASFDIVIPRYPPGELSLFVLNEET